MLVDLPTSVFTSSLIIKCTSVTNASFTHCNHRYSTLTGLTTDSCSAVLRTSPLAGLKLHPTTTQPTATQPTTIQFVKYGAQMGHYLMSIKCVLNLVTHYLIVSETNTNFKLADNYCIISDKVLISIKLICCFTVILF